MQILLKLTDHPEKKSKATKKSFLALATAAIFLKYFDKFFSQLPTRSSTAINTLGTLYRRHYLYNYEINQKTQKPLGFL